MLDDSELRSTLSAELRPGEKLLWVSKPNPIRVVMQRGDEVAGALVGVIITAIILVTFPVFLMVNDGSSQLFVRLLILIVMLALLVSLARPVYEYIAAQGIIYGVTDQRALIIRPTLSGRSVTSYSRFEQVERRERSDGSGDLLFGVEPDARRSRPFRSRKIGFFGVANVREVERLILETLNKSLAN